MANPSPCLGIGCRRGSAPSASGCCTSSSARLRRPRGPRRLELERKGTVAELVSRNGGRIQSHPLPHRTSSTASSSYLRPFLPSHGFPYHRPGGRPQGSPLLRRRRSLLSGHHRALLQGRQLNGAQRPDRCPLQAEGLAQAELSRR